MPTGAIIPPPAPWMTRKTTSSGHVLRQPAQDGAQGEDDDGAEQHSLAAEAVPQPSRRGDEDRQADQVGDDDAVHGGRGDVEVAADGRQCHVDDRDVHDVHEHRRHEHGAHGDLLVHAGTATFSLGSIGCSGAESGGAASDRRLPRAPLDPMRPVGLARARRRRLGHRRCRARGVQRTTSWPGAASCPSRWRAPPPAGLPAGNQRRRSVL